MLEAIDVLRTIMEGNIKYEEIKAEGLVDFYMEKKRKEEISLYSSPIL